MVSFPHILFFVSGVSSRVLEVGCLSWVMCMLFWLVPPAWLIVIKNVDAFSVFHAVFFLVYFLFLCLWSCAVWLLIVGPRRKTVWFLEILSSFIFHVPLF